MTKYVYISGPISLDVLGGTRAAIEAADRILELGHVPFVPHLTILWDLMSPKSHKDWLSMDLYWIKKCDVLLRLPGESKGADLEEDWARQHFIPVIHDVEELC